MTRTTDFTEGPILSKLLKFMIPILGALILQTLYSTVDLIVVGQFASTASVSGVSMGGQIVSFMTCIVSGLATAVTIIIGNSIGEKNLGKAGDTIGTSIFFFSFISVIFIAVLCIFPAQILTLLNLPEEAMGEGVSYTIICGAGYVFVTAYNLLGCIFRGIGDSKTPLVTVGIACFVNIAGDLLLVGVFHMGASGAAIATIFAQAVSVAISLLITFRKGLPFPIKKENIAPHWRLMWHLMKMAFPLAINEIFLGMSFLFLSAIINDIGLAQSAAIGVSMKLCGFIMLFTMAFAQAMAAFVAQNIGARQLKRARKALLYAVIIAIGVACVMFYITFFHGEWLTKLFSSDLAVVSESASYLKAYAIDTFFSSVVFCVCGYLNGCGKTSITMIQCLIGVAVRVPAAYILKGVSSSLFIIGLATPISTTAQMFFLIIYLVITNKKMSRQYA